MSMVAAFSGGLTVQVGWLGIYYYYYYYHYHYHYHYYYYSAFSVTSHYRARPSTRLSLRSPTRPL